jgi:hypothetical protein
VFLDGQGPRREVETQIFAHYTDVKVVEQRFDRQVPPHGFGLVYDGLKHCVNVNRLTKNTNRDFVGTPMHRYVPCRVEAV